VSTIPQQPASEPHAQELVIRLAISSLECFGSDLDQGAVRRLLPLWRHFHRLTPRQITKIVNSFPVAPTNQS
jgi:hypothetical protein